MGFLQTADDMADNTIKVLSDVLDSKFTPFLQGNGTPILTTYYHVDDTTSTANMGDGTIDKLLGDDSPIRFNRIENFPVVGLREILPSKEESEGGLLDMSYDGEVVIFPNTIKPTPYDFIVYRFPDNGPVLTFTVVDFEMGTIKSNSYYKLQISLKDVDSSTIENLENQVVKKYTSSLDNVGTQDKCIIEDTRFEYINTVKKIIEYICEQYIDVFYNKDYNALLLKENDDADYMIYDPYITKFIIDNHILDLQSTYFINLVQYDTRYEVSRMYNKTLYHNIELGDKTKIKHLLRQPVSFDRTITNPFNYYGETVGFTLDLSTTSDETLSDLFYYFPKNLIERIEYYQPITTGDVIVNDDNRVGTKFLNHTVTVTDDDLPDYDCYTITDDVIENVTIFNDDDIDEDTNITSDTSVPEIIFSLDDNTYSQVYWNLIIVYLNKNKPFKLLEDSMVDLESLLSIELGADYETFIYTPIILYILDKYIEYLRDN